MERPLILISNDDGVEAPGLHFLYECVKDMGDVWIVAPGAARSGASSSITVNTPLSITDHSGKYGYAHCFSVNGTPVDCVKLALHCIVPRKPDLMLSGINHGSNSGNSVIYSGTMGAALEACMAGIPAIGYSLLHHSWAADFTETRRFVESITRDILRDGLPAEVCLNVNFPAKVKIEGMKVVRAARSHWTEEYEEYTDPHGKPFYWLTGRQINEEPEAEDTDLRQLALNYATIVPTTPDRNASAEAMARVAKSLGI